MPSLRSLGAAGVLVVAGNGAALLGMSEASATETVTRYESTDSRIMYTGSWLNVSDASASAGSYKTTNASGSCTVVFDGTAISVLATKGKAFGIMQITVDGGTPVNVDLYNRSTLYKQSVYSRSGLANTRHSLVITWTGTKNAKATATTINVDAFDVTGTLAPKTAHVSGTLSTSTTWTADTVWVVDYSVTVPLGATLTIEPGAIVKFLPSVNGSASTADIIVKGTLNAQGTTAAPIVFTSMKDDSAGGDTDGVVATPAARDWGGVGFTGAGASGSVLANAEIRYAGWQWVFSDGYSRYAVMPIEAGASPTLNHLTIRDCANSGMRIVDASPATSYLDIQRCARGVQVVSGSPTITDAVLSSNTYFGVEISGGAPSLTRCTLSGNGDSGGSISGSAVPALSDLTCNANGQFPLEINISATPSIGAITGNGNGIDAIDLAGSRSVSTELALPDIAAFPYSGRFYVAVGGRMSAAAGTVFKFYPIPDGYSSTFAAVGVRGTLIAAGTDEEPVVFTSIRDDSVGGDTDNVAATPAAQDWGGVGFIGSGASGSVLANAEIRYAGWKWVWDGYSKYAVVPIETDASPDINHLTIRDCGYDGIRVDAASPELSYLDIRRCAVGVAIQSGSPRIEESTLAENTYCGIEIGYGSPTIKRCYIRDNGTYGVSSWGTGTLPRLNWNDIYRNGPAGNVNLSAPVGSGIDATYNFWGRISGPRDIEQSYALCEPWLQFTFTTPASMQVLGGNTACGIYGEPVNTSTGNFYYSASDLEVPGVGPAIAAGRTYNHQDALNRGALGYGWTLDCDSFVQSQEDSSALVVYPGGSRKTFTPDGNGGFVAPPGTLEKLTARTGGGYTLTFTDGSSNAYSASGFLQSVTDRYGNAVAYTRNASGAITRIAGSAGRYIDFTYTGDLLTRVTDNAGRYVTFAYSAAANLTGVTDTGGKTTTYGYDSSHRVTSVAAPRFPTSPFVANVFTDDKVTTQYDGYGSEMTFSYAEATTTIVNNRGFTVTHNFDSLFRLTDETDGAGNATGRTYNAAGLLDSITDGNDHTTTFTYDGNGNRTSTKDPGNHTTSASYDTSNNMLWSEDAEHVRTTYSYDASGMYLESVANPVFSILYEHFTNGLVQSMTLGDATTSYEYDTTGNLTEVTDPLGHASVLAYDSASQLTTTTDALGRSVTFAYDAGGHLTTTTDPLGETVAFAYDENGNRTSATDQLGNVTAFTYDVMDKLVGVEDPLGNDWAYTYDANYNLSTVTNPRSATTTYTYTANDLLERTTDPLGHEWSFAHDAAGNTTESVYPTGETVSRTFTADDLVEATTFSTGETYGFTYSPAHRLTGVTDAEDRTWTYAYNPVGWLLSACDTADGASFATTYAYDAAGRMTGLRASTEGTRAYAYDLAGDLTSLTLPGASASATFTHDAARERTGVSLPNGAVTAYAYDPAGRLASVSTTLSSGVVASTYGRDETGRVTSENAERFGYDDAGRLSEWYDPSADATTTYAFDAASNLTGVSVAGTPVATFTVDAADRITNAGFTYDAAGNLTSDGTRDFSHDAACRLTAVKDASTEATIATYTYDAMNRRVSATEASGTVFFHYDGASARVIAETDEAGETIVTYAYDDRGQLHAMTRGGATYFYHLNARGDVVALSDASGGVVNTYRYDPWGTLIGSEETVENPYRYASYRADASTGLYYCWNRYYAPELGRFLTRDIYPGETSDPVTMNPYLYCGGDPVNYVDPSGMLFGINAGEQYGQMAVDYWADKYVNADSLLGKAGAGTMGLLASLWTPGTSNMTAMVLGSAWVAAPAIAELGGPGLILEGSQAGSRICQVRSLQTGAPLLRLDYGWVPSMAKDLLHLHLWTDIAKHVPWDWFK
ncbi:MAG: RHS repeat-associated core domain-containing protein [Coriobacteriia bacterium]